MECPPRLVSFASYLKPSARGSTGREAWRPHACLLCQPPIRHRSHPSALRPSLPGTAGLPPVTATSRAVVGWPDGCRPDETPTLPYPSRLSPPFLSRRVRPGFMLQPCGHPQPGPDAAPRVTFHLPHVLVAAFQPFGHPCRVPMKKGRPSEETPSESRPRTVPQDRCRLLSSGPALASLWFGPLYAPATRPCFNLPFSSGGAVPPDAS